MRIERDAGREHIDIALGVLIRCVRGLLGAFRAIDDDERVTELGPHGRAKQNGLQPTSAPQRHAGPSAILDGRHDSTTIP